MRRLLVVDDEKEICSFVKEYFKLRNFEVDIAYDGLSALEKIDISKPDVVLLDIRIPKKNGFDTLKAIRKIDETIKIIFITAYSAPGFSKNDLLEEGAYAFVEKPINSLKSLENLVNEALILPV